METDQDTDNMENFGTTCDIYLNYFLQLIIVHHEKKFKELLQFNHACDKQEISDILQQYFSLSPPIKIMLNTFQDHPSKHPSTHIHHQPCISPSTFPQHEPPENVNEELMRNTCINRFKNSYHRDLKIKSNGEKDRQKNGTHNLEGELHSRKISPFLMKNGKKRNSAFSEQGFHPNKTMQLDKLKLEISDYLAKKSSNGADSLISHRHNLHKIEENLNTRYHQRSSYHHKNTETENAVVCYSNQGSSEKRQYTNYHLNFRRRSNSPKNEKNLFEQKKQQREAKLLEYRRKLKQQQEGQEIEELHKKSFTIKEIKPEKKKIISGDPSIFSPKLGKIFGSYYEVIAVQKKFENSKYWGWGPRGPAIFSEKPNQLNKRYESRIRNLDSVSNNKTKINGLKFSDAVVLQPWKNQIEDLGEIENDFN